MNAYILLALIAPLFVSAESSIEQTLGLSGTPEHKRRMQARDASICSKKLPAVLTAHQGTLSDDEVRRRMTSPLRHGPGTWQPTQSPLQLMVPRPIVDPARKLRERRLQRRGLHASW